MALHKLPTWFGGGVMFLLAGCPRDWDGALRGGEGAAAGEGGGGLNGAGGQGGEGCADAFPGATLRLHSTLDDQQAIAVPETGFGVGTTGGLVSFVAGQSGNAARLGGKDDRVGFPLSTNVELISGTIDMCLSPEWDHDTLSHVLLSAELRRGKQTTGFVPSLLILRKNDNGAISLELRDSIDTELSVLTVAPADWAFTPGGWHRLTLSWQNQFNDTDLYLDGRKLPAQKQPQDQNLDATAEGLVIVGAPDSLAVSNAGVAAVVDELRIYDDALAFP